MTSGTVMSLNITEAYMSHLKMNTLSPKHLELLKTISGPFSRFSMGISHHFLNVFFQSEPSFFYFIFDPAVVGDIMKTKLTDEDLDGRCSHLKNYPDKFKITQLSFQMPF